MVLTSADTKIEDSNENTDKKDTDENGNNNSQSNNIGDSSSSKDNKNNTKNTGSNSTSTANVTPQYKVTVDSSVDTAAEEKKLAEQYSTENKTDDGTTVKNGDTKKQSSGTEIAGIDESLDADETAISSNADTASEKSQSMSVWGIILLAVVAAIAVAGTVLFIRKKKKQN